MTISIDEQLFGMSGEVGAHESLLLSGDFPVEVGRVALQRAAARFLLTDEHGVEHSEDWMPDGSVFSPPYVSEPTVTGLGLHLYVDCRSRIPGRMRDRMRSILLEELNRAGLDDVAINVPDDAPLADPRTVPPGISVSLWCYSRPDIWVALNEAIPTDWLAPATDWFQDQIGSSTLQAQVLTVQSWQTPVAETRRTLQLMREEQGLGMVAAEGRFVSLQGPLLSLAAGGLAPAHARGVAESLIGVGGSISPRPAYAFLAIDALMPQLPGFNWSPDFRAQRFRGPTDLRQQVVDAFPWQLLSRALLDNTHDDLPVDWIDEDSARLSFGTLDEWIEQTNPVASRYDIDDHSIPTPARLTARLALDGVLPDLD